jgi:hypothetical protein
MPRSGKQTSERELGRLFLLTSTSNAVELIIAIIALAHNEVVMYVKFGLFMPLEAAPEYPPQDG